MRSKTAVNETRGRLVLPEAGDDESFDIEGLDFGRRETPKGFGPVGVGYKTDLMFDLPPKCAKCGVEMTKVDKGTFRFSCRCWKGEGGE